MEVDAEAGEHFGLPVVGQVADETVIQHFGDEDGGGDAAVLEGGGCGAMMGLVRRSPILTYLGRMVRMRLKLPR